MQGSERTQVPPPHVPLSQMWETLPEPQRRQVLKALARMIASQLAKNSSREEVANERA